MTDVRRIKGLEIAATTRLTKKGAAWIVPSQSLNGTYVVSEKDGSHTCTCQDFELHKKKCKHQWAVQFTIERESSLAAPIGPLPKIQRKSYSRNWTQYNLSQVHEKDIFRHLLRELCRLAAPQQDKKRKRGRPRLPLDEALFASCFKVYTGLAGRRFMTDLRHAVKDGFIENGLCYNSISNVIEKKESTPLIKKLIEMSSLPLASIETNFAPDSTGVGLSRYYRHYSAKYGHDQFSKDHIKLHVMVGTSSGIVTAVEVTDRDKHDSPMFRPLILATSKNFKVREVAADKAYSSRDALLMVELMGATPFIPFKSNALVNPKFILWNKALHYYRLHTEEFLERYHRRSIVESVFSSMKRKFGDFVRSKTPVAQLNEMLLRVLSHNVVCLIRSMYEMGISEVFGFSLPKTPGKKKAALALL